jgi:DNA-binding MarR family transcriptional regulator
MYYGWRGMTLEADEYLAKQGLSRPHHRILYVVARRPDIAIGSLIEILGISKQALNRPLNLLLERKLLTSKRAPEQHRSKAAAPDGGRRRIEQKASDHERKVLREAFDRAGASGAAAWMAVMGAIADNKLTVPQVNIVDMRYELCHFPGNEPGEGSAMSGRKMDRAAAERFVAAWCASWCRVDIDAVVAHFADDAQMRSPLALSLTGSPVVTGAENIRAYWREAYGHIESADLKILTGAGTRRSRA